MTPDQLPFRMFYCSHYLIPPFEFSFAYIIPSCHDSFQFNNNLEKEYKIKTEEHN